MKVKANRAKVRMFGMNLSIRESVLLFRIRFNTEFVDDQIAFSFVTDVRVEQWCTTASRYDHNIKRPPTSQMAGMRVLGRLRTGSLGSVRAVWSGLVILWRRG